jgi:hypothetical protein
MNESINNKIKHAYRKDINPRKTCVYSLQNNIAVILSFHSNYSIFIGTYKMATSTVACNISMTKGGNFWYSPIVIVTWSRVALARLWYSLQSVQKPSHDIVPLEEVVDNVKNSSSVHEMEHLLDDLTKNIKFLVISA